ncbi:CinA family protein [Devosia geojensis]|uniref:CinA family protein n=1 Tax=Devosia geojensis TaxID=443610 RepID=UPI000695F75D|nr:CinA family protein [Devosia geojensis]
MAAKGAPDPARRVIERLTQTNATIATAESCTGGLIAGALTDVPGASAAFYGGYVVYDNAAKTRMIKVPARLIHDYGAVSNQVARAMADGARNTAHTNYAVAVTGIAGPDGGSEKKPVGLVYLAVSSENGTKVIERRFGDIGREAIRKTAVAEALALVLDVIENGTDEGR